MLRRESSWKTLNIERSIMSKRSREDVLPKRIAMKIWPILTNSSRKSKVPLITLRKEKSNSNRKMRRTVNITGSDIMQHHRSDIIGDVADLMKASSARGSPNFKLIKRSRGKGKSSIVISSKVMLATWTGWCLRRISES